MVIAVADVRTTHVNDGIIALQFRFKGGRNRRPQVSVSRPVCGAVHRTTIAQDNCRYIRVRCGFKFTLHVVNGALRRLSQADSFPTRKAAAENNTCRLGQNPHVFAKIQADEFQNGGFTSAWPTSEDDPFSPM